MSHEAPATLPSNDDDGALKMVEETVNASNPTPSSLTSARKPPFPRRRVYLFR